VGKADLKTWMLIVESSMLMYGNVLPGPTDWRPTEYSLYGHMGDLGEGTGWSFLPVSCSKYEKPIRKLLEFTQDSSIAKFSNKMIYLYNVHSKFLNN
jgi:hypothetical protein